MHAVRCTAANYVHYQFQYAWCLRASIDEVANEHELPTVRVHNATIKLPRPFDIAEVAQTLRELRTIAVTVQSSTSFTQPFGTTYTCCLP
jgi:hypothetical protein